MSKFSVKKPITIFVAVVLVLVLGVVSFIKMTPDLMPNINMPYVIVLTTYPGATPEEVEDEISKPMERSLSTLENIKNVQSISNANYSMVVLEFNNKVNMDTISVDILQDINMISYSWDDKIGTPTIMKLNPSMIPVNVSTVSMENMDNEQLSDFVEDTLMNQLEGINGVASVDTSGMLETKINVVISQDKIDEINNKVLGSVNSELAKAERELQDGQKKLNKAKGELKDKDKELKEKKEETYDQLADAKAKLSAAQSQAGAFATQIQILEGTRDAYQTQIDYYTEEMKKLDMTDPTQAAMAQQYTAALTEIGKEKAKVDTQLKALGKSSKDAQETVDKLQKAYKKAEKGSYEALDAFSSAGSQMAAANSTLESSQAQIDDARSQLDASRDDALAKADLGSALTVESVSQILTAQNFDMPAGYVESGETSYLVSVGDKVKNLKEVRELVLFDTGVNAVGIITLGDVADVFKSDNSELIYAKINGNNGVLLSFSKQSNYATAEVCNNIADKFEELEGQYEGIAFSSMMDQGEYIELIIKSILEALVLGALFAIIILAVFLRHWKPTLIVLVAIPISLVFAVVLMYFTGITLNMISLSGLAVSVGMLVDNSIVVIENTMRLRQQGVSAPKAAIAGAKQVAAAITASTLTTICVFVPIIFTDGVTRELFTDMALTVGYSLVASLIVAITLVPAMSAGMLENINIRPQKTFGRLVDTYQKALGWSLKHRLIVIALALVILGGSAAGVLSRGFIFLPEMTSPQMSVEVQMPEGSTTKETMEAADQVAEKIMTVDEVESVAAMLSNGSSFGMSLSGDDSEATSVSMYVMCREDMKRTSQEVAEEINNLCKDMKAEVTAAGGSSIMTTYMDSMGGSGITLNVYGEDTDELQAAAKKIGEIVESVDGITEVDNGISDADPELHFVVDKEKAAKYGLTVAQVYQQVQIALKDAATATTITWKGDDYDIIVTDEDKLTPKYIKNFSFKATNKSGEEITVDLDDIAVLKEKKTLHNIIRMNQRTYLTVKAVIDEGHNVTKTTEAVMDAVKKQYKCPDGITYTSNGMSETIYDAMKDLLLMLAIAVILIYLIMVAQFQSLRSPFIIMFTIPLAFTGGLLALLIAGQEMSVISMIGFVMLSGIIVNNGIVLVDYINQLRASGMSKVEAIIEGGATRIRPVLMTCLTTVLGLSVMAFAKTAGTDMMQPVAVVCIGGLLYATLLTLFVVPILYDLMNKEEYKHRTEADLDVSDIIMQ